MGAPHDPPFRFLALPQELRDYIYSDVLTTTYLVELHQPQVYLSARASGQIPPSPNPASTRLTILRVSKSIHHEVKQVLYGLSTFRFECSSSPSLPLYQDLCKRLVTTLMQNINIRIDNSTDWKQSQNRMNYATRMLGLFGGSSIPRSTVVIDTIFVIFSDYLLEASFVDALGKLTGFKTVAVTVKMLHFMRPDCNGPNYNILDEYLKVMLGGGEGGKFDKAGRYCLTYHPRGRAACRKTALV